MIDFEVIDEKWISQAEAKKIIKDIKKGEITPEQKLALEYLNKAAILSIDEANKLREELEGLKMRKLKEELIDQIVDLVPNNAEELKVILSGSKVSFLKKDFDGIMKIVSKYVK